MKLEHLIIFLLLILIIILFIDKNKKEFFTTFSYASMDDLYEEPYIINNIITEEEAKYIIENATSKFNDSLVLDDLTQGKLDTNTRKSKTAWMYKDDPLIYNIMTRIANIVNIPLENAESLQVVKYEPNGYYKHHHDSCCDDIVLLFLILLLKIIINVILKHYMQDYQLKVVLNMLQTYGLEKVNLNNQYNDAYYYISIRSRC